MILTVFLQYDTILSNKENVPRLGGEKYISIGVSMKISENNCRDFVTVLASKEPVPGGGGAAALCGAIGTALGNMVGSLTVGKKKYAEYEDEIVSIKERCGSLQKGLLDLIDQDAKDFAPLANAYALPCETEEEKQYKADTIEECSKDACLVPLRIMGMCCEAIDLVERLSEIGSVMAVSDAGCGAAILKGALEAASLNIFINTKGLKDRAFAEHMNDRANSMLREFGKKAEDIYINVASKLGA